MRQRRLMGAMLAVALLLVTSLPVLVAAQEGDRPVLRFGVNAADVAALDPHQATGTQDRTVVDMIFNGLIRFVPGNSAELEPDLAEAIPEPTMDGDQQVWTFTLRDDVMCHPGPDSEAYPLTAEDVVYSFEKAADPDRSALAGDYAGITVAAADERTVTFTLDTPLSPTLFLPKVANYAGGFIVCAQAAEAMGDEAFRTNPVGTGPFMFESYTPQTAVNLVANDDYFRGAPLLGGVEVRYMPDTSSRELGLQSGELDAAAGLQEAQWVDRINAEGNLQADVFGVGEAAFFNFNVTVEPFDDPLVRQAIAYAISRENHQALYGAPVAENIYSVVPAELIPGGLTQEEAAAADVAYEQDLDRARELLAEAGYADGFTVDLITSEMSAYRANYEVLQAELAEIGITVNLNVVDHATMHAQIRENVNPITLYVAFRPNADAYLTQFFYSPSIVGEGESPITNFAHYAEIDDLIEQARVETDPDAQAELWRQANTQILEDMAAMPLHYQNQVYARTQNVDYGHELISSLALYPQITELTTINP
ncbi:MAG: ABC transporter substrate-binding protein [Chloroflexota bacterium]|nr:ABC transporter substrate-binding protein [Chloroflexota bacterium]